MSLNIAQIESYQAGERFCPVCKEPLPAHQTWPGARYRTCGSEGCVAATQKKTRGRYIFPELQRCDGPNCSNFIPEGRYMKGRFLFCSGSCWKNRYAKGTRRRICACGCGTEFLGVSSDRSRRFVSRDHVNNYNYEKYLTDCGSAFRDLVVEYLDGFVKLRYPTNVTSSRKALRPFFIFLNQQGMTSIEDVTPQTFTKYLIWAEKNGCRSCKNTTSLIGTFFKWAMSEGHRKSGNPVIPLIHATRQAQRAPRPFEPEELDLVWQVLSERGNTKLRLAAALLEETGLRMGELCRLRLGDIDLVRKRVFVGLPNKGKKERWAFFSSKTLENFAPWMAERDSECGHDYLLYNLERNPIKPASLRNEFKKVLLKKSSGTSLDRDGFDRWSSHRFRHTMASNLASAGADINLVMAQGGWSTPQMLSTYARVDPALARQGYDAAMRRSSEKKKVKSTKRTLNLDEYLIHLAASPK